MAAAGVHDRHLNAHSSLPRVDHGVPPIFLSHSGRQKAFVESLYDALQRVNHTAFFDKHSLPKGSAFPPHICQAARGCQLGVVVLSNDFLTSKWPMRELEMLVLERGPNATLLPLFYRLSPKDLKSPIKLSKWQETWMKKAPERAEVWEQVIVALDSFNGVEFTPGTGEAAYITRVVRVICDLLPSPMSYDLSLVKGHQRLAKVVARQFEEVARQCDAVCMVGLHGVGGLGKTTMCKIMCNFYNSQYLGKSCHIEFPSDGDGEKIVKQCKAALRTLANLSDEHLLNKAKDFDQVVTLMRENLSRYGVFLAIDNIWENSREMADRILKVGFHADSKVLLTSRSEQVVRDLLSRRMNIHVGPLPCPDHEEAFHIFQETLSHVDVKSPVNRNQVNTLLKRCCFNGSYHALALKALSQHANRVSRLQGIHCLSLISDEYLQSVEDPIRLNYTTLPEHKKYMFLDIGAVVKVAGKLTYAMTHQWLSSVCKLSSERSKIDNLISELASDGLIQLEEGGRSKGMIRMHDLYSDLARKEAAISSRFFTNESTRSEIEWERLERVVLNGGHSACFVKKLQQQKCLKLQVFYGDSVHFESRIDMKLMPSLCILKLERGTLTGIKNWSAATGLTIVHLYDLKCAPPLECVPSLPCLEELIIQNVSTVKGPINLNGCSHLKKLVLAEKSIFIIKEGIKGIFSKKGQKKGYFNALTNLESLRIQDFNSRRGVLNIKTLVNLKCLEVEDCLSLKNVDGLSGLTCLETLELRGNKSMEELGGLGPALKEVHVDGCGALKKVPDLSGLTCLETLILRGNKSMEEVGGLGPALKTVHIHGCGALKKVPDLSGLTCLETLELRYNKSMEEVGDLGPALKMVHIDGCGALKNVPDLSGLTCLETLELRGNNSMEEVGDLGPALRKVHIDACCALKKVGGLGPALKTVHISRCGALRKVPDLSGLTCLDTLELSGNNSMEEVGGLGPALKIVSIEWCRALKKVPDLGGLTCLERLCLKCNESMEEVGGENLSATLKDLEVWFWDGLKNLRCFPSLRECVHLESLAATPRLFEIVSMDTGTLANLRRLDIMYGEWSSSLMERLISAGLTTHLQRLRIEKCDKLLKLDGGWIPAISNLKELYVRECRALEEIGGDLSALDSLLRLSLWVCPKLKRIGDLRMRMPPHLQCLEVQNCGSLEESSISDVNSIQHVQIYGSGKLKDLSKDWDKCSNPSFV